MSAHVPRCSPVIGVGEHAWTVELRDALLRFGGDDTVTMLSSQKDTDRRLREVGDERLARMDAAGVDLQVLSITTPGTQSLPSAEAVPLARDANDFLADAVRRRPDRFAAFATLPTPDPQAAAHELERSASPISARPTSTTRSSGRCSRSPPNSTYRSTSTRRCHPSRSATPTTAASTFTNMVLSAGGWGWHADAGLATLRLILAGTFDRHPDLQIILGR